MATTKLALKTKKNSDGKYPIVFRVYHDGESSEIYTKLYVNRNEWSNATNMVSVKHPQYKKLKDFLNNFGDRIQEEIDILQSTKVVFSSKDVKLSFENKVAEVKNNIKRNDFDFIKYLSDWIDKKKVTNPGNAKVTRDTMNSLKNFGFESLKFKDIDSTFVYRYDQFLKLTYKSTSTRIRSFKARYNEAVKLGIGDDKKPFSNVKISSKVVHGYDFLNEEEMKLLKEFKFQEHPKLILSYCTFMFSYYAFGMNFRDIVRLKNSNLKNDSIEYTRQKITKQMVLPRLPEIDAYLKILKENLLLGDLYLFPYLSDFHKTEEQKYNRTTKCLKKFNSDMKDIAKICEIDVEITSYVARHTMSNLLNLKEVNIEFIKQVLGHDDIQVTQGYLKNFDIQKTKNAVEGKL